MTDSTESIRRALIRDTTPEERDMLESQHGRVWDTAELRQDFDVIGFAAPFVVVTRKSDGAKGSLQFQHSPRLYYAFEPASDPDTASNGIDR